MSRITLEARLIWIGDLWFGETVVGVANTPFFPANIDITVRSADGETTRTTTRRRDALLAVTRTP